MEDCTESNTLCGGRTEHPPHTLRCTVTVLGSDPHELPPPHELTPSKVTLHPSPFRIPLLSIIDRYLIRSFLKIFLVCWFSLTSLYLIVDVFSNLEEFLDLSKQAGGLGVVLREYYTPRIFEFFDRTAPLLALIAAIGSLAWMQRSNELAAVEACGIPTSRMLRPFVICTAGLLLVSIVNREVWIPRYKVALARNAQNWDGSESRSIQPQQDVETGIWITNGRVTLAQRRLEQPEFQLPAGLDAAATRVVAEYADAVDANAWHPAGFVLHNVSEPKPLPEQPEVGLRDRGGVIPGKDAGWLQPDELFIASGIALEFLAYGQEIQRYASLQQQIKMLKNPSIWCSNRQRVQVHARILRPVLDLVILLVGIPVMLARRERNMFVALAACLLVVIGIQLFATACQSLGASRLISPAALSAWIPLIVLIPIAAAAVARIDGRYRAG